MHKPNLFLIFLKPLNKSKIHYMVTGSVASIIYGEPRLTHDIDLVLQLHTEDVSGFLNLFPVDEFYCPPQEIIKTEIAKETKGYFNIIHNETGFKADFYTFGKDKLHLWAMAKRNKITIEKNDIWLAPPEYVIIRKLEYFKEGQSSKHLRDVKKILEISGDIIDLTSLEQKISEYDLLPQWEESKTTAE